MFNGCYAPEVHRPCQSGFGYLQSRVNLPAVHSSRNITV